jgi:hypothetical protein
LPRAGFPEYSSLEAPLKLISSLAFTLSWALLAPEMLAFTLLREKTAIRAWLAPESSILALFPERRPDEQVRKDRSVRVFRGHPAENGHLRQYADHEAQAPETGCGRLPMLYESGENSS